MCEGVVSFRSCFALAAVWVCELGVGGRSGRGGGAGWKGGTPWWGHGGGKEEGEQG